MDSYAQVGIKDRSLDIREEILEGDMDLGAFLGIIRNLILEIPGE